MFVSLKSLTAVLLHCSFCIDWDREWLSACAEPCVLCATPNCVRLAQLCVLCVHCSLFTRLRAQFILTVRCAGKTVHQQVLCAREAPDDACYSRLSPHSNAMQVVPIPFMPPSRYVHFHFHVDGLTFSSDS